MPSLTVGVLASNNADEIGDCLRSVPWADALLVILDTRSSDDTAEIAQGLGAKVVAHDFVDFAQQREFGLGLIETDWLFYLDSDERGTPELGAELCQVMRDDRLPGWWVPRRNYILGKEIRHGGWHPDYQLRMLKLGQAHYDLSRPVHEVVLLEGEAGYLKQPLIHYNYRTLAQFMRKQRQYVVYEAEMRYAGGARAKPWTFCAATAARVLAALCHA